MNPDQSAPTPSQEPTPPQPAPAPQPPTAPQPEVGLAPQPVQPAAAAPQSPTIAAPAVKNSKLPIVIAIICVALVVIGVLIVILLLGNHRKSSSSQTTGTSQTGSTAKKTAAQNACDLVSATEASQAVGVTLQPDSSFTDANGGKPTVDFYKAQSICPYVSADGSTSVDIRANNPGSGDDPGSVKQEYQQDKQADSATTAVAGLGDDAYWDEPSASLYMLKGDSYYKFSVLQGSDTATSKPKAEALARIVLGKL